MGVAVSLPMRPIAEMAVSLPMRPIAEMAVSLPERSSDGGWRCRCRSGLVTEGGGVAAGAV